MSVVYSPADNKWKVTRTMNELKKTTDYTKLVDRLSEGRREHCQMIERGTVVPAGLSATGGEEQVQLLLKEREEEVNSR